ncbi:MAG: hypothetical protein ACOX0R_00460 [Candidatus Dojkabacteria bacterium]|jgi:hypothetical protein
MAKQNLLPQIFEPLAIVALLGLFIIPTLTVINLSPITQELKRPDVLGVTDSTQNIVIEKVGGRHNIFQNEVLEKQSETEYMYSTDIVKRDGKKIYSKPIINIKNIGTTTSTVSFYGYTDGVTKSSLSLKIDKDSYNLTDTSKIQLKPGERKTIYLSTESQSDILFNEKLSIVIYL